MDDMYYKLREMYKIILSKVSPTWYFVDFLYKLKENKENIHIDFKGVCKIIAKYIKQKKNKLFFLMIRAFLGTILISLNYFCWKITEWTTRVFIVVLEILYITLLKVIKI
jgi:hypothetical protein